MSEALAEISTANLIFRYECGKFLAGPANPPGLREVLVELKLRAERGDESAAAWLRDRRL